MSYYGYDLTVYPLNPNAALVTGITNSATTRATSLNFSQPDAASWDLILSNTDLMAIHGAANNTDLTDTVTVYPDMSALIHTMQFNLAFGMNVSNYVNGNVNFNNVKITIQYHNGVGAPIFQQTYKTGLSTLTGTGSQLFIIQDVIDTPFQVLYEQPIDIIVTTNSTSTGTATRQIGMVQCFSFGKQQSPALPLFYTPSAVRLHIHPITSHVNPDLIEGIAP